MKRNGQHLWIALALLAAGAPAFAQSAGGAPRNDSDWDKIVLEDKAGNVMTSTGGDYQAANIGQQLVVGERMMLTGDVSKAKVVYYKLDRDGDVIRKCVKDYRDPETYIIDASCVPAAAWWSGAPSSGGGIVAGAAVAGALLLNSQGNVPVQPGAVSASIR